MARNSRETPRKGRQQEGLAAIACAVVVLLMIAMGGCGGGNTGTFPLAGVWVANSGIPRVQHYPGADFVFSGMHPLPPVPLLTTPFFAPQDTLFDSNNNLWVVDGGTNPATGAGAVVYRFLFNQVISLNTTPNPAPNFAIKSLVGPVTFKFPQFAAFDSSKNLWVSDSAANAIFEFSAVQLALPSGTSLKPVAVLVNGVAPAFNGPLGIAFDGSGNLWVVNNNASVLIPSTIVEISSADLAAATSVTTAKATTVLLSSVIPGSLPTINNPWGILFDGSGNMWFTNEQLSAGACSGSVVEFAAGTFAGPGSVTPASKVVITQTAVGGVNSLCDPNGITMNKSGDIVVANAAGNSLAQYTASQITSTGNPAPHLLIAGAGTLLNAPTGLTFGPVSLK